MASDFFGTPRGIRIGDQVIIVAEGEPGTTLSGQNIPENAFYIDAGSGNSFRLEDDGQGGTTWNSKVTPGVLYGNGAPASSLGVVDATYIDLDNGQLYRKTDATTWSQVGSVSGGGGGVAPLSETWNMSPVFTDLTPDTVNADGGTYDAGTNVVTYNTTTKPFGASMATLPFQEAIDYPNSSIKTQIQWDEVLAAADPGMGFVLVFTSDPTTLTSDLGALFTGSEPAANSIFGIAFVKGDSGSGSDPGGYSATAYKYNGTYVASPVNGDTNVEIQAGDTFDVQFDSNGVINFTHNADGSTFSEARNGIESIIDTLYFAAVAIDFSGTDKTLSNTYNWESNSTHAGNLLGTYSDPALPAGAADGSRYEVTLDGGVDSGRYNGYTTYSGDVVELYNSTADLIIYRQFDSNALTAGQKTDVEGIVSSPFIYLNSTENLLIFGGDSYPAENDSPYAANGFQEAINKSKAAGNIPIVLGSGYHVVMKDRVGDATREYDITNIEIMAEEYLLEDNVYRGMSGSFPPSETILSVDKGVTFTIDLREGDSSEFVKSGLSVPRIDIVNTAFPTGTPFFKFIVREDTDTSVSQGDALLYHRTNIISEYFDVNDVPQFCEINNISDTPGNGYNWDNIMFHIVEERGLGSATNLVIKSVGNINLGFAYDNREIGDQQYYPDWTSAAGLYTGGIPNQRLALDIDGPNMSLASVYLHPIKFTDVISIENWDPSAFAFISKTGNGFGAIQGIDSGHGIGSATIAASGPQGAGFVWDSAVDSDPISITLNEYSVFDFYGLKSDVQQNASDISTNASGISTNANDISGLEFNKMSYVYDVIPGAAGAVNVSATVGEGKFSRINILDNNVNGDITLSPQNSWNNGDWFLVYLDSKFVQNRTLWFNTAAGAISYYNAGSIANNGSYNLSTNMVGNRGRWMLFQRDNDNNRWYINETLESGDWQGGIGDIIGDSVFLTRIGEVYEDASTAINLSGTYGTSAIQYGKTVKCTAGTTVTFTVQNDTNGVFSADDNERFIDIIQYGAGQVQFVADTGVTINSLNGNLNSAGQYAVMRLKRIGANEWLLSGDITT